MKNKEELLAQKVKLANDALDLAKDSLSDLRSCMGECGVRDLVQIFNSAVKAHRDLSADIISAEEIESKSERELAKDKEYTSKVDDLLRKLSQGNKKD
jgi:RNA polymerase-binding transcription factor DksA